MRSRGVVSALEDCGLRNGGVGVDLSHLCPPRRSWRQRRSPAGGRVPCPRSEALPRSPPAARRARSDTVASTAPSPTACPLQRAGSKPTTSGERSCPIRSLDPALLSNPILTSSFPAQSNPYIWPYCPIQFFCPDSRPIISSLPMLPPSPILSSSLPIQSFHPVLLANPKLPPNSLIQSALPVWCLIAVCSCSVVQVSGV